MTTEQKNLDVWFQSEFAQLADLENFLSRHGAPLRYKEILIGFREASLRLHSDWRKNLGYPKSVQPEVISGELRKIADMIDRKGTDFWG